MSTEIPAVPTAAGKEPGEIAGTLSGIPDPVGTFYRYGLAKCLLRGKVRATEEAVAK